MTQHIALDDRWEFRRLGDPAGGGWTAIELPHTPFVADLDGRGHWFGECEYRRQISLPPLGENHCALSIGAAMHTARVFIGGREVAVHRGGYLPFEVDLTAALPAGGNVELVLRIDNRDDSDVPPGKPFDELDFCWFGGLYRGAELRVRPPVHITDAVAANEPGGGGVFVRTLHASAATAQVAVRAQVRNTGALSAPVRLKIELCRDGAVVASAVSAPLPVAAGSSRHFEHEFILDAPRLWSPDTPALHEAVVTVLGDDGQPLDRRSESFGVRHIAFSRSGGFVINGRRLRLRGTNRHQEMPRVGYAVPPAAQVRDARRIKEAGFDYVRLSHYPQAPEFLDACDRLGLVVMNCIPGWQFIGGPTFQAACCAAARDLIRRDRNHPCVVLWEVSLNETPMPEEFMAALHALAHEEYPGDQMFTCGWIDRYDVFSHSRQHGGIHRWQNGDKALVIAEYGDWEFYAANEGFDQKTGAGVFDRWSTARQFRGDGERGLRQQALNHLMALNDTLSSSAVLDGQWAMFDYARGYDPVRAAVGVMDIHRLPKFSYYFYRSQRDPGERGDGWTVGPVVFIASHWTARSDLRVLVFSNCDEVELRLNGRTLARQRPARTALTQHLPHAPFVFDLAEFQPGTLEAIAYLGNRPAVAHLVRTPDAVNSLRLSVDDLDVLPDCGDPDVLMVHAFLTDRNGTICIQETPAVVFRVDGAELMGPATVQAEAGIASAVVRVPRACAGFTVAAHLSDPIPIHPATITWSRAGDVAVSVPASGIPVSVP